MKNMDFYHHLKFNLNSFSTESLLIYYIYKNKFINNSSFYSFDKIDDTNLNKNKDVYYLRVKFDKLPDITIKNTCRTTSGTNKKIKGRFLKLIPVDIDVKIIEDMYDYTLKCGHNVFDITFDEVKEIFNFIVEENRKFEAKTADIEISKRFEKYNIK